jgi:DNA-binding IclR family transcriptional regulator
MAGRVLRVLEAFGPEEEALSASEIGRRAGIPGPSAHRIVNELVLQGMLERLPDRRLRIGVRLWEVVMRASPTLSLREVALPFMENLQAIAAVGVTQLAVLEGRDALYVERLASRGADAWNITRPGSRLPALSSSVGLVLVAHADASVAEDVLERGPTRRFSAATVTDRAQLRALVRQVRSDGYVQLCGWMAPHTTALAVPVLRQDGIALAALAVTTPNDGRPDLLPALQVTANGIARAALESGQQRSAPGLAQLRRQVRALTGSR